MMNPVGFEVYQTPDFIKKVKRFTLREKTSINAKIEEFKASPSSPSLRTHKLHGPLKGLWSFSVNRSVRILFRFVKNGALLIDIGPHDVYS